MSVAYLSLGLCAIWTCVVLTCAGIPEVVTNLGDTDTEKEQQEVFFYEKGKHYDNGKRGQDLQFGGRVHLLPGALQAGNASVILSSVTQADGGVYSCYFPRRKLTRWIRLTVGAGIPEVVTNLEDTDTEVFTREGEDAILPCGLGSPVNLKDEVFDWKKEQQEVFFYEKGMDYNNGKRGQDPQFGGRVGLLPGGLQAGNASVVLSSVTEADGGVYKCIFPPLGPTRLIRLTVERVPDDAPPNIRNAVVEPRLRLEVVEAPPSSGSVRLSCFSRGGQQQPSGLEWQTPNGTVIPAEEAPPAASSDSDGCYSISQTVKVTEPGNYTCLARQQGVHPAVRGTIQVFGRAPLPPPPPASCDDNAPSGVARRHRGRQRNRESLFPVIAVVIQFGTADFTLRAVRCDDRPAALAATGRAGCHWPRWLPLAALAATGRAGCHWPARPLAATGSGRLTD
ncbi:unnamed protein product [Gadus morhua 'NCC']